MADEGAVVVIGGTRAIGLELAKHYAAAGREVVLTGKEPGNVESGVAAARAAAGPGGPFTAGRSTLQSPTRLPRRWPTSGRWIGSHWSPSTGTPIRSATTTSTWRSGS